MREELDALIGVGWGEMQPQAQRVSQRLLHTRFGHHFGSDRRLAKCHEIAKASSTPRSLSAIVAMNPILPKD